MMDEVHNLLRESCGSLRHQFSVASDFILAGFTGTPYDTGPGDCWRLLHLVSDKPSGGALYTMDRAACHAYPRTVPSGIIDGTCLLARAQFIDEVVRQVPLAGAALDAYCQKQSAGFCGEDLAAFTTSPFAVMHPACVHKALADPEEWAPKTALAIRETQDAAVKSVIFARGVGYRLLAKLLPTAWTLAHLTDFNKSTDGVCVVDAQECGEGVSFFGVRRLVLLDIPATMRAFAQLCGRVVRLHSHDALPVTERDVRLLMYVATVGEQSSADQDRLTQLLDEAPPMASALLQFREYGFQTQASLLADLRERHVSAASRPAVLPGPTQESGEPHSTADSRRSKRRRRSAPPLEYGLDIEPRWYAQLAPMHPRLPAGGDLEQLREGGLFCGQKTVEGRWFPGDPPFSVGDTLVLTCRKDRPMRLQLRPGDALRARVAKIWAYPAERCMEGIGRHFTDAVPDCSLRRAAEIYVSIG